MKTILLLLSLLRNIPTDSLHVRDPFVLADTATHAFYLYASHRPGFKVYKSVDLQNWTDLGDCFVADTGFWGKTDFWAPDVYRYRGRYYLFATFSGRNGKRGTSILVSSRPDSGFTPLVNAPVTPPDWMCLDASLYVDKKGRPWLVFSREWLEVGDGQVLIQRLSGDLRRRIGHPHLLFTASQASWTKPIRKGTVEGYVTDAPFIWRGKDGRLILLWSSFNKQGRYAIGVARPLGSRSGAFARSSSLLTGHWTPDPEPINQDDGGHAMLFEAFGKLMISYHAPNHLHERPMIREFRAGQ